LNTKKESQAQMLDAWCSETFVSLSSTLANFSNSPGTWNAEHRIVLDDVVGTLEHEFHAAQAAEGAPATMDVGPIKQLETAGRWDLNGRC
jgi:hypothetical protein